MEMFVYVKERRGEDHSCKFVEVPRKGGGGDQFEFGRIVN
jgi:hypothetical protein